MKGREKKSLLHVENFEDFRDFSNSRFKVTISRVQQEALSRAGGKVLHPAQQIELMNAKKGKSSRAHLESKCAGLM